MNRRLLLLCLVAAVTSASAWLDAQGQPQTPVKIGGITFITGKFGSYGQEYANGMRLGVDYVNKHGGVLGGRKLELDLQDSASDSAQAATLLRRFAANPEIVGVVGPTGTPDFLAIVPIAKTLNVPVVTQASAKFTHEDFPDFVVRVYLIETPELMKWYFDQVQAARGIKRIAFVTDRSNDAQVNTRKNALEGLKLGSSIEVVADESIRAGDRDFAAVIDKMLAAKPDAIFLASTTNEVVLLMAQARARQFKGVFLGSAGLGDPKIGELAKDNAAGAITMLPLDVNGASPVVKDFAAGYKAAYGDKAIGPFVAYTFDSVLLLANAINRAGSTDRSKVMQALGSTKDFQGVTSTFTFRGKGDNTSQTAHLVEHNGSGGFRPFK
jgi:branched-chain amino acid transport system substrate-binding protein